MPVHWWFFFPFFKKKIEIFERWISFSSGDGYEFAADSMWYWIISEIPMIKMICLHWNLNVQISPARSSINAYGMKFLFECDSFVYQKSNLVIITTITDSSVKEWSIYIFKITKTKRKKRRKKLVVSCKGFCGKFSDLMKENQLKISLQFCLSFPRDRVNLISGWFVQLQSLGDLLPLLHQSWVLI